MPPYLTTRELAAATAGGDCYIRTKNNIVKGLAIQEKINPKAPEVICFGRGPRMQAVAHLFLHSGDAVPTYLKLAVDKWKFIGCYRAVEIREDSETIQEYERATNAIPGSIKGLLYLEKAVDQKN